MTKTGTATLDLDQAMRPMREDELDAVSGGWFAFHASAEAIDAVAKALATMAQKQ